MKIFSLINMLLGRFFYKLIIKINKKIKTHGNFKINGIPFIQLKNNSTLVLGKNVTLNSSNYNYHINMFKPVKILADGKQSLIKIGDNTRIHGSCIHAKDKIEIGSNCLIAANCQIFDSNGHKTMLSNPIERVKSVDEPKSITIQDNVWIGAGVYILPGVTIKSGSVIAAGSVVKTDIPENVIASGNPAMVIKKLKNE